MKVVTKLLADFVAWRWAPTVGLLSASVLFVLIVVGLVPTEIGVGVASPKFGGKPRPAATAQAEGLTSTALATSEESTGHAEPAPVVAAVQPSRPSNFGRRGFSPVIERPDPPPAAPEPPPPPLPAVAPAPPPQPAALVATAAPAPTAPPGRVAGLFQTVQNALRGGQFNNIVPPSGSAGGPVVAPAVPGGPIAPGNPPAPGAPGEPAQPAPAPGAPGSPAAPGTEGAPGAAPEAANEVAPVH
jgi:hypothetical protein